MKYLLLPALLLAAGAIVFADAGAPASRPVMEVPPPPAPGQEVKMSFGFDVPDEYARRVVYGIERYRKGPATVKVLDASGKPIAGAKVEVRQTSHDFLFGCAFPSWDVEKKQPNPDDWAKFGQHFLTLFNYATTENMLKWPNLERAEGSPDYTMADHFVSWCQSHNIRIKGHTLVWGTPDGGVPSWLTKQTPEEVAKKTEKRIRDVVGRFKGKIDIWDVVNEPLHARWFEDQIGPDYEVKALKWAREANPDAKLLINEFGSQWGQAGYYAEHLRKLIEAGAPLDAIGEQHHDPPRIPTPEQVFTMLDSLGEVGKDIHLTEITMPSNGAQAQSDLVEGTWTPELQGKYYRYLFTLAFSHPQVKAITLWAMWDGASWLDQGGIIARDWTPKPAYKELDSLINREWRTSESGKTGANGVFGFRGFKGSYRVDVSANGKTASISLHIVDSAGGEATVRMN